MCISTPAVKANSTVASASGRLNASQFHDFVRDIQDIAGGLLVTQPTYKDWQNGETRPYMEQYLGGEINARGRKGIGAVFCVDLAPAEVENGSEEGGSRRRPPAWS